MKLSVGTVKIYVAAMEALREKERQRETQFTIYVGTVKIYVAAMEALRKKER